MNRSIDIKQLYRTEEDLIAYLRFVGREDLAIKFKTQGFLYLSEVLETQIDGNWLADYGVKSIIDLGK